MHPQQHSLKVYIHHNEGDRETIRALVERLARDGVNVLLRDNASGEARTLGEMYGVIQDCHVVLFCVSKQFNRMKARRKETQSILELIMEKRAGQVLLLPVRLENCNMPASLRRWQPVDLFEDNGYERLMLALKVRADRIGASLPVRKDWQDKFFQEVSRSEKNTHKPKGKPRSPGMLVVVLILLVASGVLLWMKLSTPPMATPIPVEILAGNATQNVLVYSLNRASTLTAVAFSFSDPLTQTAMYHTGVPLTRTADYEISLYTPTPTLSPTATLTPRTIVVLPPEIMDANNVPMVLVPEGGFRMGSDNSVRNVKPEYVIYLLAFYIDKYEVTNNLYKPCVDAGVCQPPKSPGSQTRSSYYDNPEYADYPVINIDWQMGNLFCEWRGARLPTEAEWEKAARGINAQVYPWAEGLGCSFANYSDREIACVGDTVQVGQYEMGKSVYGAFDMAGNVSEWVSSLFLPFPYNSLDGREDLTSEGIRVLRGGSWASSTERISTFYRLSAYPSRYAISGNDVGFRCAHDANP